jgi:hypothetical protein
MIDSLYYYHPQLFMTEAAEPDIKSMLKWYRFLSPGIMLHDRSGLTSFPVRTAPYDQMPKFERSSITYDECCSTRAQEIWTKSSVSGLPIIIFWSGGIDSTRVLVSFLENFPLSECRARIKVAMNPSSIAENPEFYHAHVLPNFELVSSDSMPWAFDGTHIVVTGEFNDQLFGSDMLQKFLLEQPEQFSAKFNKWFIVKHINQNLQDPKSADLLVRTVEAAANHHGVELQKNADWYWWFNFCFKWQTVQFRMFTIASPSKQAALPNAITDTTYHFYGTPEFQLWSMNNLQTREITHWHQYKTVVKTGIMNFDGNQEYFDTKPKRLSLGSVFKFHRLIPAIDSSLNLITEPDFGRFYNPSNIFS